MEDNVVDNANNPPPAQGFGPQARLQAVHQLGQTTPPPSGAASVHVLTVVGQVEGHILLPAKNKTTKYEHVIPQLVAVEQNPAVKGLLVILNTVGGDIEAGLAIAEMIRSLSKPTVSLVLGGGHSIGAPIAAAAQRSFIAGTATMTVHPIRLTGLVIGVPQTYEYLEKMQERVIGFITQNSRISEAKLRELMFRTGELMRDVGTVLVGAEAVRVGLIDEVGGVREAYQCLQTFIHAAQGTSWVHHTAPQPAPHATPPPMPHPAVNPAAPSIPQPVPHPVAHPVTHPAPHPVIHPTPHPVIHPTPHPAPHPVVHPAPPQAWPGPHQPPGGYPQ